MEQLEKTQDPRPKSQVLSPKFQIQRNSQEKVWNVQGIEIMDSHMLEYRRVQVVRVYRKLKLELTRMELETLREMIRLFLIMDSSLNNIWQLAAQKSAFDLYEKVTKKYMKHLAGTVKLTIDIAEAALIIDITECMTCYQMGVYEENVIQNIVFQINGQIT